jgi:hypothetical protein
VLPVAARLFVYGIKKRDKVIYLARVGWMIMDAAIVVGVVMEPVDAMSV